MKRSAPPTRQAAFTLIEMMTVLLIIAILSTFAYPSYRRIKLKTARAEGRAALMRLMQQQERHYTEHHRYRHFAGDDSEGDNIRDAQFRRFSGETASGSAYRLEAQACESNTNAENCILLRATPVNGLVDQECDVLTLDSTGGQDASGPGDCW
jgi:type IV pilus assembly protein PilE